MVGDNMQPLNTIILKFVDSDGYWKGATKQESKKSNNKLLLPFKNPEDYVADLLYKTLPRIMNPEGDNS